MVDGRIVGQGCHDHSDYSALMEKLERIEIDGKRGFAPTSNEACVNWISMSGSLILA